MIDSTSSAAATQRQLGLDEGLDLQKEHAEKIVRRASEPLRKIIDSLQEDLVYDEDNFPVNLAADSTEVVTNLGLIRETLRDITVLAMGIAYRLKKDKEYQQTITTLARENVRLDATIETLLEKLAEKSGTIEENEKTS